MALNRRPLLTRVYEEASRYVSPEGAALLYGSSVEHRSSMAESWCALALDVLGVRIEALDGGRLRYSVGKVAQETSLRSESGIDAMWAQCGSRRVLLDITGLTHEVWAPVLRRGIVKGHKVSVVYVEPQDYRVSDTPTEGAIFDLSTKIRGIAPLPGFTRLREWREEEICFVPFLGFEGARFAHVSETVEASDRKSWPVVGVPGFRMEYPFFAYVGNRKALLDGRRWENVRYAIANCPFSAYYLLEDIAAEFPKDILKVAPIGTKPHALGAVMFAIAHEERVELVYDHPIRKSERTSGTARVLVYEVAEHLALCAKGVL